ncbi:cysteine synthase family protein [Gammaproteobacteria bacterium]|jgi:cysteine synthase A|nr:cysteine synthase family protein [Gammaproteobacteria bacterium]MDA8982232.1 cysteine synthase family protein [Gammaproteobacteria bacterium]MDC1123939.1 cysteine synthase family protein [Gammaproteobacteria bacterium]MDC3248161.1 cysteine synthase family protein [Gammaproteobacteria bacterium]
MKFDSILETVGNTPCVKINNLAPEGVELYVKAEYFNPASSVKDRLALSIIEEAEADGTLKPGQTVVEATSGNTGIGLAFICASKNYPCVITMPESASIERRKMMRFLGAKVLLTPASEAGSGAYNKAKKLADDNGWFYARQFENEANSNIHEKTTGNEIVSDFKHSGLDYWVSGYGTGGTFSGVARTLKKEMPETKLVIAEPDVAPLLAKGKAQKRTVDGAPAETHPDWQPHPIQGWTTDFIPLVLQESIDHKYIDEIISVSGSDGIKWSKKLAAHEGILTGISGGSTFAVAMEVANKVPKGSKILCMLADTAERYLSSLLFEDIEAEMNDKELNLFNSTL